MGGQDEWQEPLNSVEALGLDCEIPPLPEKRQSFGTFLTPFNPVQLAVCGGTSLANAQHLGGFDRADCVTLNVKTSQWEQDKFQNRLPIDWPIQGVIKMEGQGVFVVHQYSISVLQQGSKRWVSGPSFQTEAVCSCIISSTKFVTIHWSDENNVLGYSVGESFEPVEEPTDTWPSLLTKRRGPGCGATARHLVVAGGMSASDEILSSVEIFTIDSYLHCFGRGADMQLPRAFFQLIPIGSQHTRLLAVGGKTVSAPITLSTSEWWDEEVNSWESGPTLATGRSHFGALLVPASLVCPPKLAGE